jgi:hypothetical protein
MGTLLTFFLVGIITLVVAGVVLSVVGAVFSLTIGLAAFLLFKVAPVLVIGYFVVKMIERKKHGSLSAEDRRWLEGE